MTPIDPPLTPFDEFLDRLLRGERVDPDYFLETHPELSAEERRQVRFLTGRSTQDDEGLQVRSAVETDLGPIHRVGGYRLIRRIGAGGTGAVYLAEEEALGRQVALKVMGPDLLGTGERAERFLREVRAAARLRHPNIVTIDSAGEADGLRYMAMVFIPGLSLHEVLAGAASRGERPSLKDVLRWGADIAHALHHAHQAGIVHRDVKPSNIRIGEDRRAMLLDFGLAREAGAAALTETGAFRGSPQYASPEQVGLRGVPIDARTDIYSLGATLYEAVSGGAPFRGGTREQLFHQILEREPVRLRRLDPLLSRDLETVVLAALEKDPRRRHPSAEALARDLEAVLEGRPVSVRPISATGRLLRWARREPAKAALGLLLAIGLPLVAALGGFIVANLPGIEAAAAQERTQRLEGLVEDAFFELGEGDAARAATDFEQALREDPNCAEALAGWVLACLERWDPAGALSVLDAHPGLAGGDTWRERLRAEVLHELGRTTDAEALQVGLPPPASPVDHFVAGFSDLRRLHAERSEALDPEAEKATGTEAFEHLRQAILLSHTAKALYYHELGHAAWHAGRHVEAKEIAAAIARLWPPSAARSVAIGRTLLGADQEQALGALEEAVRQEPRSLRIRLFLGQTLVQHGRLDAALALCRETAAQNPRYVTARRDFGKALLMMGRLDEARAELLEAVRLDASDPDTRNCLGRLFRDRGDIDAAIVHLREALRLLPRSHWVRANLASMLTKKGELDEALELLRQSIKILPSADACIQLSYVLWKQDDFNEALAAAREAVRLSSGRPSAEALIALGRARKCTGDLDGAVSNYRRALLLRPEHAELLCNLGQALNERGDFREGLEILRAGHERGSGNPRWSYPSDQWVRDAERLVALEARLDEVRRGAGAPPGPKERVQLAMEVCHRKRLFAETASLLEAAFCEDPSLTSNRPTSNRSYGAASALAAGLAQGADAPADAGARSALRNRARAWFEEEITFLERRMESGIGRGSTARKALSRLSTEPALLRTLDPPTLSSLPPGEAEAWRAFKIRLDELLKRLPEE